MEIFKDFSKFGLSNLQDLNLNIQIKEKSPSSVAPELTLKDIIYQKKVKCHICNQIFNSSAIKLGKNQIQKVDDDLRTHYSIVDTIRYDVLSCPCGYTALTNTFTTPLPSQRATIREKICTNYKAMPIEEIRSTQYTLDLYQLALATCLIKQGKNIEKAIICLRISWLYHDLKNDKLELEFIKNAYECFKLSLDIDTYPTLGYDFHRAVYITSILAYKLGDYETALRFCSSIITDSSLNSKIKDRILILKSNINEKIKSKK
ncbi:hypothetical protein AN641_06585 [Candidatus Epulonipiscioides gigas]|nr:hypothetical protein AN641_06585 [Epulopiscium sp. SCG-C07WGA-EpuloA2]